MDALFASGHIVDLILLGVLGEALVLGLRRRLSAGLVANLAAGAALMLALRAALTGAGWPIVAGCLLAGLVAHLADLGLRLRQGRSPRDRTDLSGNNRIDGAFTGVRALKRL
ncbi:hypothetical protein Q8W71_22520 [Methylobacterium sp. NEAU 140]|uniref:hypothetical protein n=1 Tax=Methylobacterium sp. NEAU 140 TaxID=3064945 RepID=UPI002732A7C8|nr:hypothetical protein [Methylobacterium sp. NEAU 140]MDP4025410.1 hypothetical protein [Methylobacterium sp. NEAU 140]